MMVSELGRHPGGLAVGELPLPTQLPSLAVAVVRRRLLRRVVAARRGYGFGAPVPHTHCFALPRSALVGMADPHELSLPPPSSEAVALLGSDAVLLVARDEDDGALSRWRLAFHAAVHAALEQRANSGELTPPALRERAHRIGSAEMEEARSVLGRDGLLLGHSELDVYVELAAQVFELSWFDPHALEATFPSIAGDIDRVLALLRRDLDDAALLRAARPVGAPASPHEAVPDSVSPISSLSVRKEATSTLLALADTEASRGRLARAAGCESAALGAAGPHLRALAAAVAGAVGLPTEPPEALVQGLFAVSERAGSRGLLSRGGRLLYDLERAAHDRRQPVKAIRLVPFVSSRGATPIARVLPCAEELRVCRRLRSAHQKAIAMGLPAHASQAVGELAEHARTQLFDAARPRLESAFEAVGLVATEPHERASRAKLVHELLGRVATRGYFTMSELRDAVSQNRLKLPRLSGPRELFGLDPLLALDARLSVDLDGIYRPGEVYLRLLQRVSSVLFGTRAGATATLYLLLPLLVSFVALEGLSHLVGPIVARITGEHPHLLTPASLLALAAFVFGMVHAPRFRKAVLSSLRLLGHVASLVLGAPFRLAALPVVRRALASRVMRTFGRFVARPLFLAAALGWTTGWVAGHTTAAVVGAVLSFVGASALAATQLGKRLEEAMFELLRRVGRALGRNLLPGVVALLSEIAKGTTELLARGLYVVDEWLRLRSGDSLAALWAKGVAGLVWGALTYVVRLYVNVLVEPQVNPIKHFPVVTVSHKIILPLTPTLLRTFRAPLEPLGPVLANGAAGATVFLLPGVFGFLVWELKENWRLYRDNRAAMLRPVIVGSHGETIRNLLVPGFHAGTVPKLFAKLRRATARRKNVEALRERLHHVEEDVARFVTFELLLLGREVAGLRPARVGHVRLTAGRMSISMDGDGGEASPHLATLVFEDQGGRLVASLSGSALLDGLDDAARARFEAVLAGFYKRAAVDLVREQIERIVPPGLAYDIDATGLVVFRPGQPWEARYVLLPEARPEPQGAPPEAMLPPAAEPELRFGSTDIPTRDWEAALRGGSRIVRGPSLLPT